MFSSAARQSAPTNRYPDTYEEAHRTDFVYLLDVSFVHLNLNVKRTVRNHMGQAPSKGLCVRAI